jgi:hypothetical protein
MQKLNHQEVHYMEEVKWPSSLKTAEEIAPLINISVERLMELADSHFCPHWRVDGGVPLFSLSETKQWAMRNIVKRVEGSEIPFELRVMVDPPNAVDAPPSIAEIKNLRQIPIHEYPPGVYFLVNHQSEIVYIGQSLNPLSRLSEHRKTKRFNRAYMVPVPSGSLNAVEGALIRLFKPPLNGGTLRERCGSVMAPGIASEDEQILEFLSISISSAEPEEA